MFGVKKIRKPMFSIHLYANVLMDNGKKREMATIFQQHLELILLKEIVFQFNLVTTLNQLIFPQTKAGYG